MTRTHNRTRHDIAFGTSTSRATVVMPALAQLSAVALGTAQQLIDPSEKVNFEYVMLERSKNSLEQAMITNNSLVKQMQEVDETVLGTTDFNEILDELIERGLVDSTPNELFNLLETAGFVTAYERVSELLKGKLEQAKTINRMAEDTNYDIATLVEYSNSADALARNVHKFEMIITLAWAKQNDWPIFELIDDTAPMQAASA